MTLERHLRNRYSRQIMFSPIGEDGQVKLSRGFAVIIGCGALGTNIANFLVRAGVGKIRIIDRDFIEIHNLQRQVLFNEEDIKAGLPKAIAAVRYLKKVNSAIEIEGIVSDANNTNIEKFCERADVILDGLDNFETRLLINDVSLKHHIPWVYGGAIASSGMTLTIVPGKTACFRCVFPTLPAEGPTLTCETAGVIGTSPAMIGAMQATEAIKVLVGAEPNRELITFDVWSPSFIHLPVEQRKGCPACEGRYDFLDRLFDIKTSSFCGQSRAMQVIDTSIKQIDLKKLAARLKTQGHLTFNEYMLTFNDGDNEIVAFPDGRAIIKNTLEEKLARGLYARYISGLLAETRRLDNGKTE
jgi:molybdopterin-synthase adenylyltransferase